MTAARYVWADDCSDCSGSFVGVRSTALVGYRFVFIGPEAALGRVSDERNGADFGALWGRAGAARIRLVAGGSLDLPQEAPRAAEAGKPAAAPAAQGEAEALSR